MGIFSKPEVVILKESNASKKYLEELQELLPKATGDVKEKIEKEIALTKSGIVGEESILFELKNSGMDMFVLQDIYIETKDGLGAQIDFIVVTAKLNFIIECKNLYGNIEIDSKGNFIRTIEYGRKKWKEGIYSPITQNERHMTVLKECKAENKGIILRATINGTFASFHKSLIVLANPKTVINDRYAKKEVKNQVIRADQLINVIKQKISESKELPSSKKDMKTIAENFLEKNIEERDEYITKYGELVEVVNETKVSDTTQSEVVEKKDEELICPRCGAELVLRTAKKGDNAGNQFYGCSRFPNCRYIKAKNEKV